MTDAYVRSLERSRHNTTRTDRPRVFSLAGREWDLLDSVFPPVYSPSTATFLELLDFPVGGSMIEVGCGAGAIAVSAALAGCAQVVATDVNPEAARNAELNAVRHGVADRVRQGGSALLGFSSRGDLGRLRALADTADVTLDPVGSRRVAEPDTVVEYQLLRLEPRRPR